MDVTLNYHRAFVAGPTYRDRLRDAFRSAGAVRCPIYEDWYDLPPAPIWARLPWSPDHEMSGLSPNLCALGTAKLRLKLANHIEGHYVLAVSAQVTIGMELEAREVDWREDLVPTPGRAVLHGPRKASKLDQTELAELIARVASTGRSGSDALSLRVICDRRTAFLQDSLEEYEVPVSSPVHRTRLAVSASNILYIDGLGVQDCKEVPTAHELTMLASEVTMHRAVLSLSEENLKTTFNKLRSRINQPDEGLGSGRKAQTVDWVVGIQNDIQFVTEGLGRTFQIDGCALSTVLSRHLSIRTDLDRCQHQVDRLNHHLGWQMTLSESHFLQHQLSTALDKVDRRISNTQARLDILDDQQHQLSTALDKVDRRISNTQARLDILDDQWSNRLATSTSAMCLVLGIGLIVIAIFLALDIEAVGYALAGIVFAFLGLRARSSRSIRRVEGDDPGTVGYTSSMPPSEGDA